VDFVGVEWERRRRMMSGEGARQESGGRKWKHDDEEESRGKTKGKREGHDGHR
jgi:hypothetical protein